jgi:cytochrome c-type biogenesis protein CcmH/NrfG
VRPILGQLGKLYLEQGEAVQAQAAYREAAKLGFNVTAIA